MARWRITPSWKKSIIEVLELTKDGKVIRNEICWRWGEFFIDTEDDNPPELEEGVDMFDCGYEVTDWSTDDGCSEDTDLSELDDDEREQLEEFLEENSFLDLDGHDGWMFSDSYMYIDCELIIEKVEDEE